MPQWRGSGDLVESLPKPSQVVVDSRFVFSCRCRLRIAWFRGRSHPSTWRRVLTALRMQDIRALADSAQAPVDITSSWADQHASIAVNCGVHGRIAAAKESRTWRERPRKHLRSEGTLTLTRPDFQLLDVHLVFSLSHLSHGFASTKSKGQTGQ